MRPWRLLFGAALALVVVGEAHAASDDQGSPEVLGERDRLIDRIAHGADTDASVRRFAELRDRVLGRHDAEVAAEAGRRATLAARRAWQESYRKSADYAVSWRCTLSPDPAHPLPSDEGRFAADWGSVVRKEVVRLPPKNDLDPGEQWTMMEVKGARRSYLLRADRFGLPDGAPLEANPGDLVLVCDGGSASDPRRALPLPWSGPIETQGFAVRLATSPKIAQKSRWNPIHITGSRFYWAIHEVKWKFAPEAFVLANLEVGEAAGEGRFLIDAGQGLSFLLEAPPSLARRELLIPGHSVWAILGHARFDRALGKLVLVAEDLEERYVTAR